MRFQNRLSPLALHIDNQKIELRRLMREVSSKLGESCLNHSSQHLRRVVARNIGKIFPTEIWWRVDRIPRLHPPLVTHLPRSLRPAFSSAVAFCYSTSSFKLFTKSKRAKCVNSRESDRRIVYLDPKVLSLNPCAS